MVDNRLVHDLLLMILLRSLPRATRISCSSRSAARRLLPRSERLRKPTGGLRRANPPQHFRHQRLPALSASPPHHPCLPPEWLAFIWSG